MKDKIIATIAPRGSTLKIQTQIGSATNVQPANTYILRHPLLAINAQRANIRTTWAHRNALTAPLGDTTMLKKERAFVKRVRLASFRKQARQSAVVVRKENMQTRLEHKIQTLAKLAHQVAMQTLRELPVAKIATHVRLGSQGVVTSLLDTVVAHGAETESGAVLQMMIVKIVMVKAAGMSGVRELLEITTGLSMTSTRNATFILITRKRIVESTDLAIITTMTDTGSSIMATIHGRSLM